MSGPTHCRNHTLDLILSHGIDINGVKVLQQTDDISDHYLVLCKLHKDKDVNSTSYKYGRTITFTTKDCFVSNLPDLSQFLSTYNSTEKSNQIKSNQIKSLLLSHHHSTSALVSEILMSVLQTVQKNNRQFTYGQTVQKNNKQFTYGQTVQKNNKQFTYGQTVQKNNKQFTYGQTVQKNCTGAFTVLQTVQKKTTTIYIWTDSAKKNNNNLHMDRQCKKQQQFTYGQYIFTDCTEDNVQNTHTYTQYA